MSEQQKIQRQPAQSTEAPAQLQGAPSLAPPPFQLMAANASPTAPIQRNTDEIETSPTEEVYDHLALREGYRNVVYLDSRGLPTAGTGHLMSAAELRQYPLGSRVPDDVLERWRLEDSRDAYGAARVMIAEIGYESQALVNALTAVNFQLGTAWNDEHVTTWRLLTEHKWKDAAREAANSRWFVQTPIRVVDFQRVLLSFAGERTDYEFLREFNQANIRKWGAAWPLARDFNSFAVGEHTPPGSEEPTTTPTPTPTTQPESPTTSSGGGQSEEPGILDQITDTIGGLLDGANDLIGGLFGGNENETDKDGDAPTAAARGISGSVGAGGTNNQADVRRVQALLNNHGAGLDVDGLIGDKTIQAISTFQQRALGFQDGRVDPGGKTWGALQQAASFPTNISGSVGRGGANNNGDVRVVQRLLNVNGAQLGVDGIMGPDTIAAISSFQQSRLGFEDGRVDPGGKTWNALTGRTPAPVNDPSTEPTVEPSPEPSPEPAPSAPTNENEQDRPSPTVSEPGVRNVQITGSVGASSANNARADVRAIQQALTDIGIFVGTVDGVAGQTTKSAIRQFQVAFGLTQDGRVDPGGATLGRINSTPNGAMRVSRDQFYEDPNRPSFRHGNFTNREVVMIDKGGSVCPEQFWDNQKLLIRNLEIIGDEVGRTLNINSGYRSPYYNDNVAGGVEGSNHQWGMAADLGATGIGVLELRNIIQRLIREGRITPGGVGYYPSSNFVHYDVRGSYAYWRIG